MALKCLAKRGRTVEISSSELGESLSVSPQTASRYLSVLEDAGLVERTLIPKGQRVAVTESGVQRLRREYEDYRRIFEDVSDVIFTGEVTQGLGEGHYYMSREGYQSQFEQVLGYRAYPGTLNVELQDDSPHPASVLPEESRVRIEGFEEENRTFGAVICYEAEVRGVEAAIVVPERSHHDTSVMEVISPEVLREELGLEDGDEVEVTVPC